MTTTRDLLNIAGGATVPRLGVGTFKLEGDAAYQSVRDGLELGYRHVDTAAIYGNEEAVGRAIADSHVDRSQLFVTTKVWRDDAAPEDVATATEDSLRRLGLDHVDLLLLHWPAEDVVPIEETIGAMADEQAAGRTRFIGVSNSPSEHFSRAAETGPVVNNQVEHHVNLDQSRLTKMAMAEGGFLTAYAPLVSGGDVAGMETLQEVAGNHAQTTWHQVALAWLLSKDGVAVIPRSSSREHIEANMAAMHLDLTPDELAAIEALPKDRRHFDPSIAPDWD